MTPEDIRTIAEAIITEGQRHCSGHVLVLDQYTLERVIAQTLARLQPDTDKA